MRRKYNYGANQPLVRGALKQIFAAPDRAAAGDTLASVVAQLGRVAPKVARPLEAAEQELRAYMQFPRALAEDPDTPTRWSASTSRSQAAQTWSAPTANDATLLRFATSLLIEQNDEWLVQARYLSLHSLVTRTGQDQGPFRPADTDQPALDEGALAGVGKPTT